MSHTVPTVFIVEDEVKIRDSLAYLLESSGHTVECFGTAEGYLNSFDPKKHGCIVLDIDLPGMSGVDLHQELKSRPYSPPVIFLTGQGDIGLAVRAIQLGAIDFLEKPFNAETLIQQIKAAFKKDKLLRIAAAQLKKICQRHESLSPRERQILDLVVDGRSNREIGETLELSHRTVENHRASILRKMGATTSIELVRMVLSIRDSAE